MAAADPSSTTDAASLLWIGTNRDRSCFACGTESGFLVFNSEPLKERQHNEPVPGGIGCVSLLERTNLVALVGGGLQPKFPPDQVVLWDDYSKKQLGRLSFPSPVTCVRWHGFADERNNKQTHLLLVSLASQLFVYELVQVAGGSSSLEPRATFKAYDVFAVSHHGKILAFPDHDLGKSQVQIIHLDAYEASEKKFRSKLITCDVANEPIRQMSLNQNGTILACAAYSGNYIGIFDVYQSRKLGDLSRGRYKADIYSMEFDDKTAWLCVTSSTGTIHLFDIEGVNRAAQLPSLTTGWIKSLGYTYWNSHSSLIAFKQDDLPTDRSLCWFISDDILIVVYYSGIFLKIKVNTQERKCEVIESKNFLMK